MKILPLCMVPMPSMAVVFILFWVRHWMIFTYCSKSALNVPLYRALLSQLLSLLLHICFWHLLWILSFALKYKWSFPTFLLKSVAKVISHNTASPDSTKSQGLTLMLFVSNLFLITVMEPKIQALPLPKHLCAMRNWTLHKVHHKRTEEIFQGILQMSYLL